MSGPKTYRKRPVDVEALQWTGDNPAAMREFTGVRKLEGGGEHMVFTTQSGTAELYVAANDTWMPIEVGEWVLRDRLGFYPCKPNIFAETYEEPKLAMIANEHTTEPREPWSPFSPRVRALVDTIITSSRARDAGSIEYRPTGSPDFTEVKITIAADLTRDELHGVEQADIAPPTPQRMVGVASHADSTGMEFVAVETVHLSRGGGVTVCCRRTLFELPRDERTTTDPMAVTCEGPQ